MNNIRQWFRRMGRTLSDRMRHFMVGRYGMDRLSVAILCCSMAIAVGDSFVRSAFLNAALTLVSFALMAWAIFRTFSRNTYGRYQENRKFLMFFNKLKDREHRYFDCPKCRQPVRVPRGKGKIAITCPRCGERFIRKT